MDQGFEFELARSRRRADAGLTGWRPRSQWWGRNLWSETLHLAVKGRASRPAA